MILKWLTKSYNHFRKIMNETHTRWCYRHRRHRRRRRPWQRAIQVSRIYQWWTPMTFRMVTEYQRSPPPTPSQMRIQHQQRRSHLLCTMRLSTFAKIISNILNVMTRKWDSDFCAHSGALSIIQPLHADMSQKFPPLCMNMISMKKHRPTGIEAMWKQCKHASIIVWKFANILHRIAAICCSGKQCTWSKCEVQEWHLCLAIFFSVFYLRAM